MYTTLIRHFVRLAITATAVCCLVAPALAARNVIIMIGDGMGYQHVNAASYYLTGAAGNLCFEQYYRCGVKTRSLDSSVTDSAAAATAMATGHKTNNNVVSQAPDGTIYQTILEKAKTMGKRTGMVTTVPITHATPAAFGAHEASRSSYYAIGNDYLNSSLPDVLFGGGDPSKSTTYFSASHVATAQSLGYSVVYDYAGMAALNPAATSRALGLFAGGDMAYEYDGMGTQPHLSQMTTKALEFMNADPDGFFLMVEGGMIDHAAHNRDINRTTHEVVEFHNSVQQVLNWMQGRSDTLLIVVADHETGGLTATNMGAGNYPAATWTTTGHTGVNVPFYIYGSGANLVDPYIVSGAIDNTDVYRVMDDAFNAPVPEPSSILILVSGVGGLILARRRR